MRLFAILFAGGIALASGAAAAPPRIELPDGYVSTVAAAPPLLNHPIMASLGEPGYLFIGDAAGTNLNKSGLEKDLPNRVVLLRDTNLDGVYDKSTVFADKMTFPQGGVWLEGSLYVASPPGIWKLTDTDGDGVADRREMIVGGFEYTGNAADVHGPFLHPNGRLYWCHGRKGHEVKQKDGTLVHAGLASGIWSCRPDGSDVRWHALSCADNPTEIDFTPEGEIIGTVNLFYTGPRGDTLIHWLRGGIYPREDQIKAIQGLPRTLETLPVAHNFGHVAVSGCTFYRSGALNADWRGNLFVVHFNTQRITRMEMAADGATYKFTEREFFKLNDPDAHLTDVLEDRDGSLLVIDTGGWFRAGCPSSVMAKPDVAGAIYRIRKSGPAVKVEAWGAACAQVWELARKGDAASVKELARLLTDKDAAVAHAAANALATIAKPESAPALSHAITHKSAGVQLAAAHALGELPKLDERSVRFLMDRLSEKMEPVVEHQVMFALLHANKPGPLLEAVRKGGAASTLLCRRALEILDQLPGTPLSVGDLLPFFFGGDDALENTAGTIAARHRDWAPTVGKYFHTILQNEPWHKLDSLELAVKPWVSEPSVREVVSELLENKDVAHQRVAWRLIAASSTSKAESRWIAPLQKALDEASPADQRLVLEAVARVQASELEGALKQYSTDQRRPLALRLKALSAILRIGAAISAEAFSTLLGVLDGQSSGTAKLEAARILGGAKLNREQLLELARRVSGMNAIELREAMRAYRSVKEVEIGNAFAMALTKSVALATFQESEIRSFFGYLPPDCFAIVSPALRELAAEDDGRRRRLETLPAIISARGHATEGRKIFEAGKGACSSCHRIGEVGNLVGPNLSTIGQIRGERDILESILFPSSTLARDYEAQTVETVRGDAVVGIIRKNLPEAIVLVDASGQEHTVQRSEVTSMQASLISLMPVGLDHAVSEEELIDLVAYLRSRK